jgi:hypothetical protein
VRTLWRTRSSASLPAKGLLAFLREVILISNGMRLRIGDDPIYLGSGTIPSTSDQGRSHLPVEIKKEAARCGVERHAKIMGLVSVNLTGYS